jgi:2-haloacid dehalogenase
MTDVIAFDVNETLLDLSALDVHFDRLFGDNSLRPQWFAQMLQLSFIGGLTGRYVDFSTAQHAALRMLAQKLNRSLSPDDADALVGQMSALPPHPEVPSALKSLSETRLTVVALVNSLESVGEAQLRHAGIRGFFDRVISADSVRHLKPAPQPYLSVARAYGVAPADVRLVAAHHWDVSGALSSGCKAAFVARPGMTLSPVGDPPDIIGPDLASVASDIIAADT